MTFTNTGADVRVIPQELRELPLLRGFDDDEVLGALAGRFVQREFEAGDVIVEAGRPADQVFLIAHGKVNKLGTGQYGDQTVLGVWPTATTSASRPWSLPARPGSSPSRR